MTAILEAAALLAIFAIAGWAFMQADDNSET